MLVNGKNYTLPDLNDFDTVLQLEEKGINFLDLISTTQDTFNAAPFTAIRDVLACLMVASKEEATQEIKEHVKNGGNLMELMNEVLNDINKLTKSGTDSGFSEAEKTPQKQKTKKTVKSVTENPENQP